LQGIHHGSVTIFVNFDAIFAACAEVPQRQVDSPVPYAYNKSESLRAENRRIEGGSSIMAGFCTRCGRPLPESGICPCTQQPQQPQYQQPPHEVLKLRGNAIFEYKTKQEYACRYGGGGESPPKAVSRIFSACFLFSPFNDWNIAECSLSTG